LTCAFLLLWLGGIHMSTSVIDAGRTITPKQQQKVNER
jgi:hypothetical protein